MYFLLWFKQYFVNHDSHNNLSESLDPSSILLLEQKVYKTKILGCSLFFVGPFGN